LRLLKLDLPTRERERLLCTGESMGMPVCCCETER
jgi:hypothetical protein